MSLMGQLALSDDVKGVDASCKDVDLNAVVLMSLDG